MEKTFFSVVVITYNSSKYVIETLESIKNQSYDKIELIISDDSSQDNTVEICENWLRTNKSCFVNTDIITVDKNSGIPANCNRGVKVSTGEWIKIIAGDDILKSTAIEDYANYINSVNAPQDSLNAVFARIASFENSIDEGKEIFNNKICNYILFHPEITQKDQVKLYCRGQLVKIITMVFRKKMFDEIKGFDEEYPLRDDRPFMYKILSFGYKLHFMNKLTFFYRQHGESIMHVKKSEKKKLEIHIDNVWAPHLKYRFPNLSWLERILSQIHYKKNKLELYRLSGNKDYKLKLSAMKIISKLANYVDRLILYVILKKFKLKYKNSYTYAEIKN